ncbi:MAG: hypothetical protein NXI04_18560 [Planctomycetaceae bacterium]|nr:hypothetical protein [Planctomycetaceae bacterium]
MMRHAGWPDMQISLDLIYKLAGLAVGVAAMVFGYVLYLRGLAQAATGRTASARGEAWPPSRAALGPPLVFGLLGLLAILAPFLWRATADSGTTLSSQTPPTHPEYEIDSEQIVISNPQPGASQRYHSVFVCYEAPYQQMAQVIIDRLEQEGVRTTYFRDAPSASRCFDYMRTGHLSFDRVVLLGPDPFSYYYETTFGSELDKRPGMVVGFAGENSSQGPFRNGIQFDQGSLHSPLFDENMKKLLRRLERLIPQAAKGAPGR